MIVRTRPFLPAFDQRVDRVFNQLTSSLLSTGGRAPVVDARWADGDLVLTVDLPGTPDEAVHVDVAGRTLTIAVETDELSWSRGVRLGTALDAEAVTARYLHGRLTVTVPAAPEAEKRTIAISTTPALDTTTDDTPAAEDDTPTA